MAHEFPNLTWERFNEVYDEENNLVSYLWNIAYVLVSPGGTNGGCYYAEMNQLPEEPTREDVEALIMSLFPAWYEVKAPVNDNEEE